MILITGATGFVGGALSREAVRRGLAVRGTILPNEGPMALPEGVEPFPIAGIGPTTEWPAGLAEVDTVVHLAARVHVMREHAADPLAAFRAINTQGTRRLAEAAAARGVRRFVFLSTIGANGDNTGGGAFTEADPPAPHNAYSVSKLEAEEALWEVGRNTAMEVVVLRAPLVYGAGNPGNFLSLLKLVDSGLPLPLASVDNRRSFVYVGNLVDALLACAEHPAAAGNLFLVSDGEEVSTPQLIRFLAGTLGRPARLFGCPPSLLRLAGAAVGKRSAVNALVGSLVVDASKIRRELGWRPRFTLDAGLEETAVHFRRCRAEGGRNL